MMTEEKSAETTCVTCHGEPSVFQNYPGQKVECPTCKKAASGPTSNERVEHPGCGGVFVETRTANSTNGPWTCDKCGAITQSIDRRWGFPLVAPTEALEALEADADDAWTKVFERIVDEREQRDDDGTVSGDRIAVRVMKNGTVDIQVERKLVNADPELAFINHDWSVDPDCGVCTSREGAVELAAALRDALDRTEAR